MPGVAASSFDTLRTWNGEQSRAFEELSFQLLKDRVPTGARAIRTGNPDGGVEWYATSPDGIEWGWQAKHVKGIDALLTAMTESVNRVAKERPQLKKLTFVISWNLSTSTRGNERKSQRQKYEDKVGVWKKTIKGADQIEFDLVQESDLLEVLSKPEHNGRRWLWWNELVLGPDWLEQRYEEQRAAASEKYRPDLQVDIPIQDDLLALGFDPLIVEAFGRLCREIKSAVADLQGFHADDNETAASFEQAIQQSADALRTTAGSLVLQAGDAPTALRPLQERLRACAQAIDAADEYWRSATDEWRALPANDPAKGSRPPERFNSYAIRTLRNAIRALESWLRSSPGDVLQRRTYFLTGQAGSGKTHLFLDATRRALDADRPAIFLAAAQFGQGNLWASMTDQLGLEPVGADLLLRAMDAAGEAASVTGARFVIFVDALNETTPPDFWHVHLPRLRAAIAPYRHIALAVSCRDTYRDLVLEGAEASQYVCRTHPGFADREVEATQRYFDHYGLEAPKLPLLTPEFTLPLFLRLYCESFAQAGVRSVPAGHQGRIAIFERYLTAKISAVARRFRPGATSKFELDAARGQVRGVLDALLDEMSCVGRETMSVEAAQGAAGGALEAAADATRVIGLLQEEGVLTREHLYLGGDNFAEGVRIVFQAFADFLLLKRRLALSNDPLTDDAVKNWLTNDCSWGITEAATILLPEVYGVELSDLLGVDPPEGRPTDEHERRARQLYRSLVEMLPYRASEAISPRTVDLLNAAQPHMSRGEFYRVMFMLAPQPGNRLNGEGLHEYLLRRDMPQRDRDFGFATYRELSDGFTPAARLARWAAAGPYPTYTPDVVELACIPLCWLLSSPNRFMRDWVTKALVQLLRGHLDVTGALVRRFWKVNDPYVVQRVVVMAYGALLRSTPSQVDQAKALTELVHTLAFTRPVRPDELMLDAARGVVRWAVARNLLPVSATQSSQRPYGLKPPGPAFSAETIKTKYGWEQDQPDDESYHTITFSLFELGDFGRYVVDSGLDHFSRYRFGQDYPERQREPRFVESRWRAFVASLTAEQQAALADWLEDPDPSRMSPLHFLRSDEEDPLSEKQRKLFASVWVYPKPVDDGYPTEGARRWVFRRTLSLGWTPQLFGKEDRDLGHGSGREEHKAERWGKKYQWMAYHELLARVADNFQASRQYDELGSYEGLHQFIGDREIDPSLPPIAFRTFNEKDGAGTTGWRPPLIRLTQWPPAPLNFSRYQGDAKWFMADVESEPSIATAAILKDQTGDDWVVLQGYMSQNDPLADKSWRGLAQRVAIDTVLVEADGAAALMAALAQQEHHDTYGLIDNNGHIDCCYVGEVGRTGPNCPHRYDGAHAIEIRDKTFQVVPTTEKYTWEGSLLDCSIGESAAAVLPSTFFQSAAGLTFDMRGPSWLDATGTPVFTYYEQPGNSSHVLVVRASFLRDFLAKRNLELVVLLWFQRMEMKNDYGRSKSHPYIESTVDARLGADLAIWQGSPRRTERDLG